MRGQQPQTFSIPPPPSLSLSLPLSLTHQPPSIPYIYLRPANIPLVRGRGGKWRVIGFLTLATVVKFLTLVPPPFIVGAAQERAREAAFRVSVEFIASHNRRADAGLEQFRCGLNDYSDLTQQEWSVNVMLEIK